MRNVLVIAGAVAAMAAFTAQAQAAHTAAELHIFFGAGQVNPATLPNGSVLPAAGELTANPSVTVPVGATVVFPIWARVLQGDGTQSYSALGFRVFDEGNTASVSNNGNGSNPVFPSTSQFVAAGQGSGSSNSLDPTLKEFRSGYFTQLAAGGSNLGQGTYFLGYMSVAAVATGSVDFSFANGADAARLSAGASSVSTLNTVAYGATDVSASHGVAGSQLNSFRRLNTLQDVIGTVFDQASDQADAHITVIAVPEPMTIGLLAVGAIGLIRRRKTA